MRVIKKIVGETLVMCDAVKRGKASSVSNRTCQRPSRTVTLADVLSFILE